MNFYIANKATFHPLTCINILKQWGTDPSLQNQTGLEPHSPVSNHAKFDDSSQSCARTMFQTGFVSLKCDDSSVLTWKRCIWCMYFPTLNLMGISIGWHLSYQFCWAYLDDSVNLPWIDRQRASTTNANVNLRLAAAIGMPRAGAKIKNASGPDPQRKMLNKVMNLVRAWLHQRHQ